MEALNEYIGLPETEFNESDFINSLPDELKEILTDIKKDLIEFDSSLDNIKAFDRISNEIASQILEKHHITVQENFKEHLVTPFAVARYVLLVSQQNTNVKKVEEDLSNLLDKSKISWLIHKNFSNTVTFSKQLEINSDQKPQSLTVKYNIDPDNDIINYAIFNTSWSWDINKSTLKAILEDKELTATTASSDKLSYEISENKIKISAGGIEIAIKKT